MLIHFRVIGLIPAPPIALLSLCNSVGHSVQAPGKTKAEFIEVTVENKMPCVIGCYRLG